MELKLFNQDNIELLKTLPDNSIDSIVTDPPYGISFMGKKWDYDVPSVETWKECLRVLKHGGHILVACGTRTQHRMAVNIEDAGFEIRDIVAWIYGSGFPKSLNIGKKIKNYEGWGTALKPAMELWTMARKPLFEKNIAENVLKWETGGINIDGSRVKHHEKLKITSRESNTGQIWDSNNCGLRQGGDGLASASPLGRFPANVIHDGSDEVTDLFPNDSQRFFYCAKASKSERNAGCEHLPMKAGGSNAKGYTEDVARGLDRNRPTTNFHPTVKPVALMRYLVKMITPAGGMVLDPFMGSGSTGVACMKENFSFTGIELDPEYFKIAEARINNQLE